MTTKIKLLQITTTAPMTVVIVCLISAFAPNIAPVFIAISGAVNEALNIILQQFVRDS